MDWKERLKKEYSELKERYKKLKAYNTKLEVKYSISRCGDSSLEDSYRCDLLRNQQRVMGEYLHVLEIRAELEGIELWTSYSPY